MFEKGRGIFAPATLGEALPFLKSTMAARLPFTSQLESGSPNKESRRFCFLLLVPFPQMLLVFQGPLPCALQGRAVLLGPRGWQQHLCRCEYSGLISGLLRPAKTSESQARTQNLASRARACSEV